MTYHLKDSHYPGVIIKEIEKKEYELIKNFNEFFNLYEGVFYAFSNYHNAKEDYKKFQNSLNTINSDSSLDQIYRWSIYPITSVVIFLNTFLDNTKSFNTIIKSKKIREKINKINKIEAVKILRAVRNYSIHASIPIKGNKRITNIIDNTKKYEFFIEKKRIIKNKPNRNDLNNLQKFKSNRIKLNHMIEDVADDLRKLHLITFEEFIEYIPEEIKYIIVKYVRFYKTEKGVQYFANSFVKSKKINELKEKVGFVVEETIYFDSKILKAVASQIYPDID